MSILDFVDDLSIYPKLDVGNFADLQRVSATMNVRADGCCLGALTGKPRVLCQPRLHLPTA